MFGLKCFGAVAGNKNPRGIAGTAEAILSNRLRSRRHEGMQKELRLISDYQTAKRLGVFEVTAAAKERSDVL